MMRVKSSGPQLQQAVTCLTGQGILSRKAEYGPEAYDLVAVTMWERLFPRASLHCPGRKASTQTALLLLYRSAKMTLWQRLSQMSGMRRWHMQAEHGGR